MYTPLTTVPMLLSQAIDPDPWLRPAVSRSLGEGAAEGCADICANTGGYSQARQRLREGVLQRVTRQVGADLLRQAPGPWLWKKRAVKIVDGTTVSTPDTPANQADYPQPANEKPGLGFPLARLAVLFSLAVDTVLDVAPGRSFGKQAGETALFRTLHDRVSPVSGVVRRADLSATSWKSVKSACVSGSPASALRASWW